MSEFVSDSVTWDDKLNTALIEGRRITRSMLEEEDMDRRETRRFFSERVEQIYCSLRFDGVDVPEDDISIVRNRARVDWADNPIGE